MFWPYLYLSRHIICFFGLWILTYDLLSKPKIASFNHLWWNFQKWWPGLKERVSVSLHRSSGSIWSRQTHRPKPPDSKSTTRSSSSGRWMPTTSFRSSPFQPSSSRASIKTFEFGSFETGLSKCFCSNRKHGQVIQRAVYILKKLLLT